MLNCRWQGGKLALAGSRAEGGLGGVLPRLAAAFYIQRLGDGGLPLRCRRQEDHDEANRQPGRTRNLHGRGADNG